MSIWSRIVQMVGADGQKGGRQQPLGAASYDPSRYAVVDAEVSLKDKKVRDIGALRYDGAVFHRADLKALDTFLQEIDFLCGHNIVHHDAPYLFPDKPFSGLLVDTLYFSPLLFPERPYHRLVKDEKLIVEELNNPVNDCKKAKDLLLDEVDRWHRLALEQQQIFSSLLLPKLEFMGFLYFVGATTVSDNLVDLIRNQYQEKICRHADLAQIIKKYPVELAYALALISTTDRRSITPGWVLNSYPAVEYVIHLLRQKPCNDPRCPYCQVQLDARANLKRFFGYDQFRTYQGEPLQQKAVEAALSGRSLLAIFPTGGGKSLTFQLPALVEGRTAHGLTVVISPLQSLMKDQVDNLADRGIEEAVYINGLLDPISRTNAIERVQMGDASLLYIAPEMLRSKTIERVLMSRHVVRFVIDEAHCFSSWGQDFRVDYLYIGKFIRKYQQERRLEEPIPISCLTATAKQKVVQDICDYFKRTLDLDLDLFASKATRTNLHYSVIHAETDEEKYQLMRGIISQEECPTIVYVSRTKRARELAERLSRDGYKALPYYGKMDSEDKVANQEAFMTDSVRIIVATSAFGMGVDKSDVGLVIHYDISDSLENYVQEAGRAGRDPKLEAKCYVLYSDNDLDKHFILLNQTKLSLSEIQQVWKAVKTMTAKRVQVTCSALEIARQAGWDDTVSDIETRVRTALSALEESGYLERGNNIPHVYATGITVKNMEEARLRLEKSVFFEKKEIETAARIIKSLITQKYTSRTQEAEAESRIDYLADILGLTRVEVVSAVNRMRQEGILADSKDISAYLLDLGLTAKPSQEILERFAKIERYILERLQEGSINASYKQINDTAIEAGISVSKEKDIRTLLYFLSIKGYTRKKHLQGDKIEILPIIDAEALHKRFEKRLEISRSAINWLYQMAQESGYMKQDREEASKKAIQFSVIELQKWIKSQNLFFEFEDIGLEDVEEALLYLSKIGALKLEGGFLVLYNAMKIHRLKERKFNYKKDDYKTLSEFYMQKMQQIHIVGEYANLMVRDYEAALIYVQDYFLMDYTKFIAKYFRGERRQEIERNITPERYKKLFGELSERQREIIQDRDSRCIVVGAGPGSGKTRVLVHKLASLLLLEDVKHEQLLMLTFSRAAAIEFKLRLMELIGNAAHFVEIKTFHSYCFDLLGRVGRLEEVGDVVSSAVKMIQAGDVEPNRLAKTVLVIDEAQDMSKKEYELVKELLKINEEMRVIAVGDDDQNIFAFRGSDSSYMKRLADGEGGRYMEMTENYRSAGAIVRFAQGFTKNISHRMKKTPIQAMKEHEGLVEVVKHIEGTSLYEPLVEKIKQTKQRGSIGVLTQTNEEALSLRALLLKEGIPCRLIQTMEGFRFISLMEVRHFIKYLEEDLKAPLVPLELWEEVKKKTFGYYADSESLHYLQRCISIFERTHPQIYLSDFKNFVYESSLEDFCELPEMEVVISTIHKAKGLEFDQVYLLVDKLKNREDDQMRCLYVGITRARKQLFIHTRADVFEGLEAIHTLDNRSYEPPQQMILQLSHKDLKLGHFKDIEKKKLVLRLKSGVGLYYRESSLYNLEGQFIAGLSDAMKEKLSTWEKRGYRVEAASVGFIVAWRDTKAKEEEKRKIDHAILLPELLLTL